MGDGSAIDDLIRRAADPAVSAEVLKEAIGAAFAALSPNDRPGAEAALRRLAEEVIDAPTRPDVAGTVALFCGALVESGLDPRIAINPILERLERQIAPDALAFVGACRQAAEDASAPPSEGGESEQDNDQEQADPVEQHGERIAELMPAEGLAFQALEPFSLATVAMLSRSVEARKASRSRTVLRTALDELGGQYGYAGFLWIMMQVLDDELLVVLHPGQRKGYRVRISGLADNFQLHTLLADALVGRFSGRWVRARRPTRAEVAAARDGKVAEGAPAARGVFNLWNWQGLKPDGTLRDVSQSASWIWNEGVPADIAAFEGTRVVLLGPPPYDRSWSVGRRFPSMAGDLRVEAVMTSDEVRDFLRRIAAVSVAE